MTTSDLVHYASNEKAFESYESISKIRKSIPSELIIDFTTGDAINGYGRNDRVKGFLKVLDSRCTACGKWNRTSSPEEHAECRGRWKTEMRLIVDSDCKSLGEALTELDAGSNEFLKKTKGVLEMIHE